MMSSTEIDIQIQGRVDFVCGKNYNYSNKPSENQNFGQATKSQCTDDLVR